MPDGEYISKEEFEELVKRVEYLEKENALLNNLLKRITRDIFVFRRLGANS